MQFPSPFTQKIAEFSYVVNGNDYYKFHTFSLNLQNTKMPDFVLSYEKILST